MEWLCKQNTSNIKLKYKVMAKKYYNTTTGKWYYEGQSMTMQLPNMLFMGYPTEEQLTEWGYEEYIEPEPTEEELLQRAKDSKIAELEAYDSSDAVNSFSIGGQPMWLTVEERQQIATQISAHSAAGLDSMTRWFEGQEYTFPVSTWYQMLTALELYAGDALNVTEGHKAAIKSLQTVQEVEDYDFTTGYPCKMSF